VKDVRTGHETSNVDGVMDGQIDDFWPTLNDDGTKEELQLFFTKN
jgi:hypothetical protein